MSKIVFQTIGLLNRQPTPENLQILIAIKDYLLSHHLSVCVDQSLFPQLKDKRLAPLPQQNLAQYCDLLIVIGGDGSLLHAARLAVEHKTPLVGINRGHLGFLADIKPQDFERQLGSILTGTYQETQRFFLEASIQQPDLCEIALNEVALLSGGVAQIMEYQLSLDQQFVCAQRADGLIIATPTGSTAYALSAGGPILHPQLNALAIVPICPHTLSARPLIVSADSILTVTIMTKRSHNAPGMSCDGYPRIPLTPETIITIRKKVKKLRLIHPPDYQYFEILRGKLQWQNQ